MAEYQLVAADQLSPQGLTDLTNAVYADYYIRVRRSTAQVEAAHAAWDIDLAASRVALHHGTAVGVALVGRRGRRGWIGGMGVLPAWRRQGVAAVLLGAVQEWARSQELAALTLEVLTQNAPAIALYRGAGFVVQRELLVWERPEAQGALPDPYFKLRAADPAWAVAQMPAWHDTTPCWQRAADSYRRLDADVQAVCVPDEGGQPQAYSLFQGPHNGRIELLDLGVAPGRSTRSAGRELLQGFHLRYFGITVTLLNEPVESQWNRVFAALGYYVRQRQHEMVWQAV